MIPFPSVYSKSFLSNIKSCPETNIDFPSTGVLGTSLGIGFPNDSVCPLSNHVITVKPSLPHASALPNKNSNVGLGYVKAALIFNASIIMPFRSFVG